MGLSTVICWDAGRAAQLKQMSYLEVAATIGACSGAHRRETRPIAKEAEMVRGAEAEAVRRLALGAQGARNLEDGAGPAQRSID